VVAQNVAFWILAIAMAGAAIGSRAFAERRARRAVPGGGARRRGRAVHPAGRRVRRLVQVLIYIGAIVILFLFGIMLTRAPMRPEGSMDNSQRLAGAVVSCSSLA
jgi:NADH-quinone oxidoreductase subunit J